MSKVTKWAVETAKSEMSGTIRVKMANWDKANPIKGRDIPHVEIVGIAMKDPKWQAYVLARVKRGNNEVYIGRPELEAQSPMVAAAVKANAGTDEKRNQKRADLLAKLETWRDEIIRTAIIGDMDSADLLKAVNDFCKR